MSENKYIEDINKFNLLFQNFPKYWDGKSCINEMRSKGGQWRQMEWCGWYFELKCKEILKNHFSLPGDKFGNVEFDCRGNINWDFKNHAIQSGTNIILNDKEAIDTSLNKNRYHGFIVSECDVKYDEDGSFKKWHDQLKGRVSSYQLEAKKRKANSRKRKVSAELKQIIFMVLNQSDLSKLIIHKQGRNADGANRKVKYQFDLRKINEIYHQVLDAK